MANNNFNVIGIDFTEAKESLKAFLQSQDTLKDYSFDGSVLNTVLDVLAYNTHYQAFYANMVANEMFLDSAVLRPSVASHAKNLGYVPTSRRAAKAILGISAPGASESTYLSRGTEFTGVDGAGTQYKFVLLDTVYADEETDNFSDVEVYEGTLRRMSYIYDPLRKTGYVLLIPNDKIDTNTLRVRVKSSATDNTGLEETWTYASSYIDLTPTSKVYFLQEKEAGMYELFFGDNFLGQQPQAGNVVIVEYLETNGDAANGIESFTASVSGITNIKVASASSGGALEESVNKIKFLAPRYYQAQSRAVTEDDYTAIVMKEYPNADSVFVYGGETVTPPQYGKVFIAIKPKSGSALTTDVKNSLINTLKKNRSVVTIVPEIIDPEYIDVIVDSLVTYDPSQTSIGVGTIKALVVSYLYSYSVTSLESFGSNLYFSNLTRGIDSLNGSILGNQTNIRLRKLVNLTKLVASKGFTINFNNPLYHPHDGHSSIITTNTISHQNTDGIVVPNVYAEDDGFGKINLMTKNENQEPVLVYPNIGTINYAKGIVNFSTSFVPITTNSFFAVTVQPQNKDIFVFENKILRISRGYADSVSVSLQTQVNRKNSIKA
jgi:hypothetical protein